VSRKYYRESRFVIEIAVRRTCRWTSGVRAWRTSRTGDSGPVSLRASGEREPREALILLSHSTPWMEKRECQFFATRHSLVSRALGVDTPVSGERL